MGKANNKRVAILVICLLITTIIVNWDPPTIAVERQSPLAQALADIEGWKSSPNFNFAEEIVASLDLDEYVNRNYSKEGSTLSLYIGYYYSLKKVGAAHSPLVCFPGQGWVVSETKGKKIKVKNSHLNLMTMVVTKGENREFLIYWFQSYDKTSPGTLVQKFYTLMAKYIDRREDNAFVRVSVSLEGKTKQQALTVGIDFIESFYPDFIQFVL